MSGGADLLDCGGPDNNNETPHGRPEARETVNRERD